MTNLDTWHPTPVLLPGKSHGQRTLVGCSPWGHEESDMTEQLHFHALEKEMATHSSILAWRGFTWWLRDKEICLQCRTPGFDPWVRKIPWRRAWQPTPVFLPEESHRHRSPAGYSPWGWKESDMTEQLSTGQRKKALDQWGDSFWCCSECVIEKFCDLR